MHDRREQAGVGVHRESDMDFARHAQMIVRPLCGQQRMLLQRHGDQLDEAIGDGRLGCLAQLDQARDVALVVSVTGTASLAFRSCSTVARRMPDNATTDELPATASTSLARMRPPRPLPRNFAQSTPRSAATGALGAKRTPYGRGRLPPSRKLQQAAPISPR